MRRHLIVAASFLVLAGTSVPAWAGTGCLVTTTYHNKNGTTQTVKTCIPNGAGSKCNSTPGSYCAQGSDLSTTSVCGSGLC